MFQLTAARRRLAPELSMGLQTAEPGFNSQPPEGGWGLQVLTTPISVSFQLTAARRRLVSVGYMPTFAEMFQLTAARRRLAGFY